MQYYNYIYLDPRKPGKYTYDGLNFCLLYEPFYVGKGKNNRWESHLYESKYNIKSNKIKINKIRSILSEHYNLRDYVLITNYFEKEIDALLNENNFIKSIGSNYIQSINNGPLTNLDLNFKETSFKPFTIFDINGDIIERITDMSIQKYCEVNGFPSHSFLTSARMKGKPMYVSNRNVDTNLKKFIGAYIIRDGDVQNEKYVNIHQYIDNINNERKATTFRIIETGEYVRLKTNDPQTKYMLENKIIEYRGSNFKHSDETKKKMSRTHKTNKHNYKQRKITDEHRKKLSEKGKKPKSENTKRKMRETALKREKIFCPHCGRWISKNVVYKYHLENCKFLKVNL